MHLAPPPLVLGLAPRVERRRRRHSRRRRRRGARLGVVRLFCLRRFQRRFPLFTVRPVRDGNVFPRPTRKLFRKLRRKRRRSSGNLVRLRKLFRPTLRRLGKRRRGGFRRRAHRKRHLEFPRRLVELGLPLVPENLVREREVQLVLPGDAEEHARVPDVQLGVRDGVQFRQVDAKHQRRRTRVAPSLRLARRAAPAELLGHVLAVLPVHQRVLWLALARGLVFSRGGTFFLSARDRVVESERARLGRRASVADGRASGDAERRDASAGRMRILMRLSLSLDGLDARPRLRPHVRLSRGGERETQSRAERAVHGFNRRLRDHLLDALVAHRQRVGVF